MMEELWKEENIRNGGSSSIEKKIEINAIVRIHTSWRSSENTLENNKSNINEEYSYRHL